MTSPAVYPTAGEPAPPPGPGVEPPFAAPPTDRNNRNLWIGLGIGALILVLCCVGSLFGVGVLYSAGTKQVSSEARAVVTAYLEDLRQGSYAAAYQLLCPRLKEQEPVTSFAARHSDPQVIGFTVGDVHTDQEPVTVSATVEYEEVGERGREYTLSTPVGKEMTICGER